MNRVVTEGLVGPDGQPMPAMDSVLEAVTDGIVMVEGGAPHASSHITGGSDVIPDAVPGGASGLMSGADKAKLDGIEPGAQVNQNAFSYVKVGATTIEADSTNDTLELAAGSNIALTPDAASDKVTIAVTGTVPSAQNADTVDGKHASDFASLGHGHTGGTDGNPVGTSGLQDGAVTDGKVGNRTVDQAQVPTGSTGTLTQLFSWLANRIKAITGMANWFDNPVATLAAIWAKFHGSTGHKHTGAADDAPQVDYANIANKPVSFPPAPHASSHHSGGGDALSLGSIAGTLTDTQHGNRGGGTLHSAATASTAGFMSAADKAKLDGIQSGAEVNQNAFASVKAVDAGGVSKGQVDADAKTDVLTLKEGTGISLAVDAGTDTITIATTGGGLPAAHASTHITGGTDVIPNAVAGGASGLMSGADKQKLDGIQAGAEVNQNAFANVLVGGTTIAADSKTDTLELVAGTNIALTPDATNDRVTIAVSGTVASASDADTVDGKHASDLVLNAGSTPSIQAGADASKPAAGIAGRLYIATDTQIIYRDSGSAWAKVGVVKWGDIDGKPSSFTPSAHKSSHASGGSDALAPGDIGAVSKAGDMLTGPLGFRIGSANPRYHQNVAAYEWSTSSAVGAFVIETPISATEFVMMRLLIEGYFYDSTSPFLLIVGGYIYGAGPAFYSCGYINLGKKRPLVRWGRNTTTGKVVLIIGDVGDTYSYPKLWVSLLEGHNPSDAHRTGWTITQKTDLTGYDLLTTVPDVGAFWHAGNDGAGSGLDADTVDGYHASSFAVAPIPVTSLKRAQGSSSAAYFAVHQYAFASPTHAQYPSYAIAVVPGAVNINAGTVRCWAQVFRSTNNWDSTLDNSVSVNGRYLGNVTWDYLAASGYPRMWAIVDDAGNILSMWEAEDPVDGEFPDECPIGLADERENSIIPVGGAVVPVQFPTEQQLVALKGILAKTPMPQFASRGVWVGHKTPEGIVKTIFDKEMQSRGLEPIPDVREALYVQEVDKRNWRIQLWLRAVSRVRKDHRAFTLIPLFEEMFRVDKRTGKLEFK